MKTLKLFSMLTLCLFFVSMVSSAQYVTTNVGDNTLQLFIPESPQTIYNENYQFNIHVSNRSNGEQLSNSVVDCYVHIYGEKGEHIYEDLTPLSKDPDGVDHYINLSYVYFQQADKYNTAHFWCNSTDGLGGQADLDYLINMNGRGEAGDNVKIFFSVIFLAMFMFGIVYFIRLMGLLINLEVDLLDVGLMWGTYFGLLLFYRLEAIFLGNVELYNWLDLFISMGSWGFIWIPIVAFLISFITSLARGKRDVGKVFVKKY